DHTNNNISDENACVAAGFMWMEEGHEGHDECHNVTSHANEDIDNQVDCEAAGHEWIEHEGHMEPGAIMLGFDTNNDSHLSWDELMEVFMDDDHGDADHNGTEHNGTEHNGTVHDEHFSEVEEALMTAMNQHMFHESDANNDGLLNLSELEHFAMDAERMENMPEPGLMASAFMSVFDEDNSSSLSMSEFTELVEFNTHEDDHEGESAHANETTVSNHSEDDADGHDHMNATKMAHHLFSMQDGNNDSALNLSELTAVVAFMNEDDHDEGAFLRLDIDVMGDYGMALPPGVTVELVMEGGDHAGHGDHEAGDHDDGDHDDHDDHDDNDADHNDEGHDEELAFDPHSWLDLQAFSAQVSLVADLLSTTFPDGADAFEANAAQYIQALGAIDGEFTAAFGPNGSCDANTVASNHNAYAYMSARYGIQFVTVHGLDPEGEPSAEDIAEVVESVSEDNISVMFIEEYTDASAVDSIVDQTGVQVLTLYTMEMAPSDSDDTYISMMTKNLNNLKTGLDCL
ncbi:zinc ABC transporter substrate-binding protein, partial [Candidatus Poseidonia sp.]|nr:zinc ABC transporter substrate-binding protein [Poseidonia sp.]